MPLVRSDAPGEAACTSGKLENVMSSYLPQTEVCKPALT